MKSTVFVREDEQDVGDDQEECVDELDIVGGELLDECAEELVTDVERFMLDIDIINKERAFGALFL